MTQKEAAAKCREWAAEALKNAIECKPGSVGRNYYNGMEDGYEDAANLIDQINVPQPWPPPINLEEVLAYHTKMKDWVVIGKTGKPDWQHTTDCWGPFSHYLHMPPAPEETL
jgi:hypothetical protein